VQEESAACSSKLLLSSAHMDGLLQKPTENKIFGDKGNAALVSLKRSLLCFFFVIMRNFCFSLLMLFKLQN